VAVVNKAKFQVTGSVSGLSASSARVHNAVPGEVLTLQLESYDDVLSVTYDLYDAANPLAPLASINAPSLTFPGSVLTILVNPASGTTTITLPTTNPDTHSWILRATASRESGSQVFERKIVLLCGSKPAKNIPGETTQSAERGWADRFALMIERSLPFYNDTVTTADATVTSVGEGAAVPWYVPWDCTLQINGRVWAQQAASANNFKSWLISGVYKVTSAGVLTAGSVLVATTDVDLSAGVFLPVGPTLLIAGSGAAGARLQPQVAGVAATSIRWRYIFDVLVGKLSA
jgi:hypothetical protein